MMSVVRCAWESTSPDLLMHGGYTGQNMFDLTLDYRSWTTTFWNDSSLAPTSKCISWHTSPPSMVASKMTMQACVELASEVSLQSAWRRGSRRRRKRRATSQDSMRSWAHECMRASRRFRRACLCCRSPTAENSADCSDHSVITTSSTAVRTPTIEATAKVLEFLDTSTECEAIWTSPERAPLLPSIATGQLSSNCSGR
jgi:hypothetical protein